MRGNRREENGFTLLEVVIAMVIFTVFCAASLGLLLRTDNVTKGNLDRTSAANLASEYIQVARSQPALSIVDGTYTRRLSDDTGSGRSSTVFTVKQTSKYLASDSRTSLCDSSSTALAYRLVTVTVTWPEMGSIQPVRIDTLKSVGVGTSGLGSTGALAVTVTGADGTNQAGQTVTIGSGSTTKTNTTGDDGCAVFVGIPPGTYTSTLNNTGYVGLTNEQTTTKTNIGVTAGTVTKVGMSYDTVRSMAIALDSPVAGAIVPDGLKMLLSSSTLAATSYAACPPAPVAACATPPTAAGNGVAKVLYPAIYTVKMGTCTETTPSTTSIDLRPTSADGSTAAVPMGAFTVKTVIPNLLNLNLLLRQLTFTHVAQSGGGCTSGESYTLQTSQDGTTIMLPYGTWNVTLTLLNLNPILTVKIGTVSTTLSPTKRSDSGTILVQL